MFNRDVATSRSTNKKPDSHIVDPEFGVVACRRSPQARFIRVRVSDDGSVKATLPKRAPLYLVKELLESSRAEIRTMIATQKAKRISYENGMRIGRSHQLILKYTDIDEPKKKVMGQYIVITLPNEYREDSDAALAYIQPHIKHALRREAMAYLPRRLRYLADNYGFNYERERFGNQKGRWGSCSSSGTISLNVALMNLPLEIIDYVLIHELAHTREMNHSADFWEIVEQHMPNYREHRKILKSMSPIC